jgi:hypothetical protein
MDTHDIAEAVLDTLLKLVLLFAVVMACAYFSHARTRSPFPANHDSVRIENEVADSMRAWRYADMQEVLAAVQQNRLISVQQHRLIVARKLPTDRRYALPATVAYIGGLNERFEAQFNYALTVDSAIRPASVQKKLRRWNRSAAPATGDRASTHERGTTVDLSRRLTRAQYRWLVVQLLYDRAVGKILVIQERACFHIFVIGEV